MTGKYTAVYGIYRNRLELENAVDVLREAGFRNTDISALLPDNQSNKDFVQKKLEGAAASSAPGAAAGGALGWLASAGALAIPGLGPFIAAGPIMGALGSAGTGGLVGGVIGALVGTGLPEEEARRYEGMIKGGGMLLSVHSESSDRTKRATGILEQTGAKDISSSNETSADRAKTDRPEQAHSKR